MGLLLLIDLHAAASWLLHRGQQVVAGLLAATAGLGAEPAVLVHPGMPLAFVPAALADGHTRLEHRPGHVGVVLGLTADHPQRSRADIRAVQAQTDALG